MFWECAVQTERSSALVSTTDPACRPRVLVADDQTDVLEALRPLLKGEGYDLELINSPAALLEALSRRSFDLLLMDLNYARDTTSGREGLDLLSQIHQLDDVLPVVAMTAWGSVELAVEIMREGVRDFVLKPWDNGRVLNTVRTEIEKGQRAPQSEIKRRVAPANTPTKTVTGKKRSGRSLDSCRKKFRGFPGANFPGHGFQFTASAATISTFCSSMRSASPCASLMSPERESPLHC